MKSAAQQMEIIKRGVVDVVTEQDLAEKLKKGAPLRVKLGIDPTASDIHLGHSVALNKLRQFQDLGHKAVLIIGDYTAMIGDPSGRMSERPALTRDEIMKNVESYKEQALKILDGDRLEIVFNGDWFEKFDFSEVVKLVSKFTIAQMMEHDYFDKRFKEGAPLSLHEMFYPIMQGYDSVMIKADIELGGTDQRFNVIQGRYLQRESGMEPQAGLFTPILLGLDGKNKMSKSLNNYIGLNDAPEDMFGKVMSITDDMTKDYFELLTDVPAEEIKNMMDSMAAGENPVNIKKRLAEEITAKYCGEDTAAAARAHFEALFAKKEVPYADNIFSWDENFPDKEEINPAELLTALGMASSGSEANRLVKQGGFALNGEKITDFRFPVKKSLLPVDFKAGKRKYGRLV
ncbi:MAG: tyrosine--tRNA ligase [Candidatus Goldiibacteriota bacterium]